MQVLTEIGNLGVVGPAAVAGSICLWLCGAYGLAIAFTIQTLVVFGMVVGLKYLAWESGGEFSNTFLNLIPEPMGVDSNVNSPTRG